MRLDRMQSIVMLVACFASLFGCGKKAELIPGAESMTREQKLQEVNNYCAKWTQELAQVVKVRNLPGIACTFQGAEADPKGCELMVAKFNEILLDHLSEVITYSPVDIGRVKAVMRFRKGSKADLTDADCCFTLSAAAGPGAPIFHMEYRPDPRVFAVFLPEGK